MSKRINFWTVKLVKEKSGLYETKKITSPDFAYKIANEVFELQTETRENFCILTLNTKNEVIGAHTIHIGTLNASAVHPRESFQQAILNNATSIVMVHNHPSGDPSPSREDIEVTKRFKEVGEIIGIKVLDHIILGENSFVSLKEKGYL